jgi:hypothetical protein
MPSAASTRGRFWRCALACLVSLPPAACFRRAGRLLPLLLLPLSLLLSLHLLLPLSLLPSLHLLPPLPLSLLLSLLLLLLLSLLLLPLLLLSLLLPLLHAGMRH